MEFALPSPLPLTLSKHPLPLPVMLNHFARTFSGLSNTPVSFARIIWYERLCCATVVVVQIWIELVLQVVIVITDGKQTKSRPYTELTVASQGVKDKGIAVYAVGVGKGVDASELQQIASSQENVYTASSFKEVHTLAPQLRGNLCDGK